MKPRVLTLVAGMAMLFCTACEKIPALQEPEIKAVETYFREGVAPVTLSAGYETRTELGSGNSILWNKGDAVALMKLGTHGLGLIDSETVRKMDVGEKKSIIMVNPASNGCFLGYDGTKRVRNSDGLADLVGGTGISPDVALANLKVIDQLAENLRDKSDYIFTLERVEDGWLLYHKASGIGLTSRVGKQTYYGYQCVLGTDNAAVNIKDGSSNAGSSNLVYGRPEQIWVVKQGGTADGYYLWSGGSGTDKLTWSSDTNSGSGWTSWLFYELPESGYTFTADESGVSTTLTNTTGFEQGSNSWYALYPATASISCEQDILTFSLPQKQYYKPGSFDGNAFVSVGVLQDDAISFRSTCGILKLSLQGTQRVRSILVKDVQGFNLWGTGSVTLSEIESGNCSASVYGGSDIITLDCEDGVALQENEATDFYIVVPVGAFAGGFEVEVVTTSGTMIKSTSRSNTIERAQITAMPAFALEARVPEINIQNEVVNTYMSFGTYDYFGASSYLDKAEVRTVANACNWIADKPVGFPISWEGSEAVSISVVQDGAEWYTEKDVTIQPYTITNLTPGCSYSYTVERNGNVVSEGKFTATGQVRMVSITDAWNCRDLGGWTGLEGKTIKYGKIFRTASLNGKYVGGDVAAWDSYEFHGQTEIDRLGIKAELDLRGDPYTGVSGMWGAEGTQHSASLLKSKLKDADFQRIMTDYGLNYPRVRSALVQDIAWIISELQEGKPVAFHCRIGADRTGAVAYLIEGLLGVREGDLARDYELTSFTSYENKPRYASSPNQSFFTNRNGLPSFVSGKNLQEKCYYYLNQYFDDVHINAKDLDWFICEMLGLSSYNHPADAKDYENNSLEDVVSVYWGSASSTYPEVIQKQ